MTLLTPPPVAADDPSARPPGRAREPEVFDFRRRVTLGREDARHLEIALGRFARHWGTQLATRLRAVVQVGFEDLLVRSYDEYASDLPTPTLMMLCDVGKGRQTAALQVPLATTFVWVDHLVGGRGLGDAREERELTDIETTLVRDLLQATCDDLAYSFTGVVPLTVAVRGIAYNPQFAQAMAGSDSVLVARFSVRVGARTDVATLMLPADLVLGALHEAERDDVAVPVEDEERAETATRVAETVLDAPVELVVRLAPATVRPRDVLALAPGDVLPLSHPASRPLEVVVEEKVLARAALGSTGRRLACQIIHVEEQS